jgi:hypothetical protein
MLFPPACSSQIITEDVSGSWPHCKSGSQKNGIRKSSRKTYNQIMGIYRFEADTVIIKKEIIISFLK